MEMYFRFWPPEGEHIILFFFGGGWGLRGGESGALIQNISQHWVKSFMIAKVALLKCIVHCEYVLAQVSTPILTREYTKIVSNLQSGY